MRAAFPENQRQVEESPCDEARVQQGTLLQRERRGGRRHRRRRPADPRKVYAKMFNT